MFTKERAPLTTDLPETLVNVARKNGQWVGFMSLGQCMTNDLLFGSIDDGVELVASWLNEDGSLEWYEYCGGEARGEIHA